MLRIYFVVIQALILLSNAKDIPSIYADGDIIIGGLFPVHEVGSGEGTCGAINMERGIQRLEAMRFAIKDINEDPTILKGVKLGVKILDTCSDDTHALDQSLDFVMSTLAMSQALRCPNDPVHSEEKQEPIMAVVGGAYSSVSIQVANLLRLFQIPQISYASTSAELSKKDKFGYFMRTVPPDKLQAKALVDIVQYFNWTYVSTVASEGEYGDSGIEAFKKEFEKQTGQCIATSLRIRRTATKVDYLDTVNLLYKSKKARVVILFVRQDDAAGILNAATSLGFYEDFIWLASDGWGNGLKVVTGSEKTAHGALTITLQSQPLQKYDTYFKALTPENNWENIWFKEYWADYFGCSFPVEAINSTTTVNGTYNSTRYDYHHRYEDHSSDSAKLCTGKEQYTEFSQESKIQFVYDAVYAVAVALNRLYKETCGDNADQLCESFSSNGTMRTKLLQYIKENKQDDPYGNAIRFDENGDSLGFYNIMNYRYDPLKKQYEYSVVGSWEDNHLRWNADTNIIWPGPQVPGTPMSICSLECDVGWRKEIKDFTCCWSCIKCEDHEFLPDPFTCKPCDIGFYPNENKTACLELTLQYVRWESPFAIIPAALSLIGLVLTTATVLVFIKFAETPVVKAAGRELSFMLLTGCIVCYIAVFILLIKPSLAVCVIQRFVIGAGFAIIYASLLVKTNRIYRIFSSASKTTKRPGCISPESQIIIALVLASVQILVFAVWLVLEPPGTRTDIPNPNDRSVVVLKCNCQESSVLISLSYNMLLIIICTVYAILTRKIPSSFNESKFIGFTMYTTCIVWLSFVPIYFGLKSSFEIQVATLCTAVFLCSTVALVCLFGPKIHIILFQPHKNKRKSTTERQRFSTNLRVNKTEMEYMGESPTRSRTSSLVCSSPAINANGSSKKFNYELKDPIIPEEMTTTLLVEQDNSSAESVFSSNDGEKAEDKSAVKALLASIRPSSLIDTTSQMPQAEYSSTPRASNSQDTDKTALKSSDSSKQTGANDPLTLDNLKETGLLNLNHSLLQSLDIMTRSWDYIDSSGATTPALTPSTCPYGDSGIGISNSGDKIKLDGSNNDDISNSSKDICTTNGEHDEDLPERLI